MRLLYYPGCSMKGTAVDYEESFLAVSSALGLEIVEMEDWKCCGASVAKSVDRDLAEGLAAGTLAKAAARGLDLVMPCPSCYLNHRELAAGLEKDGAARGRLGIDNIPVVRHALEVLSLLVAPKELARRVVRPLAGISALPYYGCLAVRPFPLEANGSIENPQALERLIESCGARPLPFPAKTDCCGGALLLSRERVAVRLAASVLKEAGRCRPDCIVVVCPLCHFMLDAKQRAVEKELGERMGLPVLYFTQLLGLAMGIGPKRLGLHRSITPMGAFFRKIGA